MSEYDTWERAVTSRGYLPLPSNQLGPIQLVDTRIQLPVFKATQRKYANAFFCDGSLRVGTLWDYRKQEHAEGIRDSDEGLRLIVGDDGDVAVATLINAKDSFIFCTSEDDDRARFSSANYDAAYRINDLRFFGEVALALLARVSLSAILIARMIYENDEHVAEEMSRRLRLKTDIQYAVPRGAYLKYPNERYQREIRAYFEIADDPNSGQYPDFVGSLGPSDIDHHRFIHSQISPIDIKVPNAIKYASPVWNCGGI